MRLLREMKDRGVQPDAAVYSRLLEGAVKAERW
jgi:hypothetical protein